MGPVRGAGAVPEAAREASARGREDAAGVGP